MPEQENASEIQQEAVPAETPVDAPVADVHLTTSDPAWDWGNEDAPASAPEPEVAPEEPAEEAAAPAPSAEDRSRELEHKLTAALARVEEKERNADRESATLLEAIEAAKAPAAAAPEGPKEVPRLSEVEHDKTDVFENWVTDKVGQMLDARMQGLNERIPQDEDMARIAQEKLQEHNQMVNLDHWRREYNSFAAKHPDHVDHKQDIYDYMDPRLKRGQQITYEEAWEEVKFINEAKQNRKVQQKAAQAPDMPGGFNTENMRQPTRVNSFEDAVAIASRRVAQK